MHYLVNKKNSPCVLMDSMLGLAHQGSLNVSVMGKDYRQTISKFAKPWSFCNRTYVR